MATTKAAAAAPQAVQDALQKLTSIRAELANYYLEREDLIQIIFVSLLAAKHAVVYGPPGTGKSDLLRGACSHVVGIRTFIKLMTKTTVPDETEGALDVPKMMATGEYRRRRAGKLTDCEVAFLDEIFKANSMILNTMLMIMNEKEYEEEGTLHPVPLVSVFGASNELPESKELQAFADRFVFKFETKYLAPSNRAKLHRRPIGDRYVAQTQITLADLEVLQEQIPLVNFPEEMSALYDKLLLAADLQGLRMSDRAVGQAKQVMAANAVLNGRTAVINEDLELLEHMLWKDPKDKPAVRKLLLELVNPMKQLANEFKDEADAIYTELLPLFRSAATANSKTEAMASNAKLSNISDKIKSEIAKRPGSNVKVLELADEYVTVRIENTVRWLMGRANLMTEV